MAFYITQAMVDDLRTVADAIEGQLDTKQGEIDLVLGLPVIWSDTERLDMLKWVTLIAYITSLDVACYPLSTSAVVFFP